MALELLKLMGLKRSPAACQSTERETKFIKTYVHPSLGHVYLPEYSDMYLSALKLG